MVFSENGRRVRKLTSPCKCHALDHKAWPQKDGNIQVALCMERCPYCAMEFPSCFDLQDHLREATYRARGLKLINTLKTMPAAQAVVSNISRSKSSFVDLTTLSDSSPEPERRPRTQHPASRKGSEKIISPSRNLPAKQNAHSIGSALSSGTLPHSSNKQTGPSKAAPNSNGESSKHSRTKVQILLEHLHDFDARTKEIVQNIDLSTSEDMSTETRQMWLESTTTYPRIFDSDQCWVSKRPSSEDMIFDTLDLIASRKLAEKENRVDDYQEYCPAFRNGAIDPDIDPRTAIAQLYEPNKTHCVALIGYRLLDLLPDGSVKVPGALSTYVEPHDETNLQALLTPKFWVTDLHIDNSDGISTTLGPTEKIWMMFPPTLNNLELMRKSDAQKEKLARIGKDLEGGLIFKTTSADVIYIPIGCIHTVFTIHGGFLLTMEFNTPVASPVLSRLFNYDFDKFKEDYAHAELPTQFIESIELALKHNHPLVGLKAWIDSEEHIRRWTDNSTAAKYEVWNERRSGWKRKVDDVWNEFFKDRESKKVSCPCGRMESGEGLKEHFKDAHAFTKAKTKTRAIAKGLPKSVERPKRKRTGSSSPTRMGQEDIPAARASFEDARSESTSRRGRSNARSTLTLDRPRTIQAFEESDSDEDIWEIQPMKFSSKRSERSH